MNQVQVKYARTRAEEIKRDKLLKLQQEHTVEAVTLTTEQKIEALKKGEVTFITPINQYATWYNCIKFNAESRGYVDTVKINEGKIKINVAFTKLMDELVLGDNEEALKLLAAFEAS